MVKLRMTPEFRLGKIVEVRKLKKEDENGVINPEGEELMEIDDGQGG